jgi:hypothetical protein
LSVIRKEVESSYSRWRQDKPLNGSDVNLMMTLYDCKEIRLGKRRRSMSNMQGMESDDESTTKNERYRSCENEGFLRLSMAFHISTEEVEILMSDI